MKKSTKLGFSLIELSVVLIVIGILVAGISQGSRLLYESKLKSAQSLSVSSPVNIIPNLSLWLDASDVKNVATGSVLSNYYGNINDKDPVVSWRDRNPNSINKTVVTAPADINRATYVAKSSGELPAIRFNGSTTYFIGDNGIDYGEITAFYVVKLSSANAFCTSLMYSYGTWQPGAVQVLVNCNFGHFQYNVHPSDFINNNIVVIDNKSHILTLRDDNINHKEMYVDGANEYTDTSFQTTSKNLSNFTIGAWDQDSGGVNRYLLGDISEIIIFSRYLQDSEIEAVESYLSQKYSIKLGD